MMNINIINTLFSFVILFVVVSSIFYLISRLKLNNIAYWLLGGYTFTLVIAVIIYALIPIEKLPNESELAGEEVRADIIHHVAYRGHPIDDFEEYKVEEWEFNIDSNDKIGLNVDSTEHYFPVLIKRDSSMTNISAALYYVESDIELEPVFEEMNPVGISFENTNLIISTPLPEYYRYATLAKEFPFTQFNRSEEEITFHSSDIYTGEHVFYLEVPDNQEFIFGPNIYYEYVD